MGSFEILFKGIPGHLIVRSLQKDECRDQTHTCHRNAYCVNREGQYEQNAGVRSAIKGNEEYEKNRENTYECYCNEGYEGQGSTRTIFITMYVLVCYLETPRKATEGCVLI